MPARERSAIRGVAGAIAAAAVVLAGCDRADVVPCVDGVGLRVDGQDWCAFSSDVIRANGDAVMCPLATPIPLRVGGGAVCTDARVTIDEVPDDVLDLVGRSACEVALPAGDDCLVASHLDGDASSEGGCGAELVRSDARFDPGGSCGDALRGGEGERAIVISGDVSLAEHRTITIDVDVFVADRATGGPGSPAGAIYVQQDGEHALYLEDGRLTAILGPRCGGSPARFHARARDPQPFPTDGRWHHVTLYADAPQHLVEVYLDGQLAVTSDDSIEPYCGPIAMPTTSTGARVGGGEIDGLSLPAAFPGWIDELVVRRGAHTPNARQRSGRCVEDDGCASAGDAVVDRGSGECVARSTCTTVFACAEQAIGGTCE